MKTGKKHSFFFYPAITMIVLSMFSMRVNAQDVKATATLDSNVIEIGQQVKLILSVRYRADNGKQTKVTFPEIADTLRKEVEIVSQSGIDTIIDINDPYLFTQTKTLYITSFDSGYWAIPPFKFITNTDSSALLTEPLLLQVNTIAVDTTQAIKDIKGIYAENYNWVDWLKDNMYVVYLGLAALIITILIIVIARRYKKREVPVVVVEAPKIPAHIIAYGKLEQLRNEKLWQEGKLKLYHSSLTDILREYIENRFKIQAMEQTTDEIIYGFRNVAIDEESKAKLKQVLVLADLVKFAKEQPLPTENESSMNTAYEFVNGTKRDETEEENAKKQTKNKAQ